MKRTGFSLWELIGVVALVLVVAAVLFVPDRASDCEQPRIRVCHTNLKQIALGLLQYRNDFDSHCPLVAVTNHSSTDYAPPYGWADALQPYIRNTGVYQCPSDIHEGNIASGKGGFTDYWFNSNLSGRVFPRRRAANVLAFGDGNDGSKATNARYSLNSLPPRWLNDQDQMSPAFRHPYNNDLNDLGANYAFADAHVKCLKPHQITTAPPAPGVYTFAIK